MEGVCFHKIKTKTLKCAMAISQSVFLVLDIVPCKDDEDTGPETSFRESLVCQATEMSPVCVSDLVTEKHLPRSWKVSTI